MNRFLRFASVLLGLLLVAFLFRGPLFRAIVHYEVIGERTVNGSADRYGNEVQPNVESATGNVDPVINAALDSTARWLHFTTGHASSDPQMLRAGDGANCIGYANLFVDMLDRERLNHGLYKRYKVEHLIGQLHIGRFNIHQLFNSPFWKDHDIVRVTDLEEGSMIYIDPTLYDAIGIVRVRGSGWISN